MTAGHSGVDPDEFRSRLVAFLPRLRRFCHALAGDREVGDDLLQAVVEHALTRMDRWQPGTSLENWVFRMARNLHIDHFRAARRRGVAVDIDELHDLAGHDQQAALESRSDLEAVQRALSAMPVELREVMTAVVIDEQPYKDAAVLLDIPIGTVMSRLSRARKFVESSVSATVAATC